MCRSGTSRDRDVMFRSTLVALTASDTTSACDWPYVDCPRRILLP